MALNEQQERFAQLVAVDRKSQKAAYLDVYGAQGMSPSTVDRRARTVANHPEVLERINVLRAGATKRLIEVSAYTLQEALNEAEEARQLAIVKGQASAAAQATKLKAQIAGHVLDRKEVSEADPLKGATLEQLATMRDEITRRMQAAKDVQAAQSPTPLRVAA